MKHWNTVAIASAWLGAAIVVGCASQSEPAESVAAGESQLLNSDQFLYFTCNATGWALGDATRLKSTSNPSVFTLDYQVTQPWLVSSPDRCALVLTNQLNGYGTAQSWYSDLHPSTPLSVPGTDAIVASSSSFAVKYPTVGPYTLSVDWNQKTLAIAPSGGILGDCGLAPKGSARSVMVDYVLVHESALSRWCVDRDFWSDASNAQAIQRFFDYGDAVYSKLQSIFNMPLTDKFVYQVWDVTGGASTGSDFGFGVSVTGDAFPNVFNDPVTGAPIPGFWGYLLTLHEAINDFTALVSPGWPSDWWADHRSPFPNSLDSVVMHDIGTALADANLLAAAQAQHKRFGDPDLPGYDSEVGMFDKLYAQYGGYSAFTNSFALVQEDGINWDTVDGHISPSEILTEYVIAYLQLGIRTTTDLTESLFIASGVGSLDTGIGPYPVDPNAVRAIATAHCSIRAAAGAGRNVQTELDALRTGNYRSAIATGGTQAACPAECAWTTSNSRCIARF